MEVINLPIEIYAIISSYIDFSELLPFIWGLDINTKNSDFWYMYLSNRYPGLINKKLKGSLTGYIQILDYYDKPYFKEWDKSFHDGNKQHYINISEFYKEFPVEFESLVDWDILSEDNMLYLISLISNPKIVKKLYKKGGPLNLTKEGLIKLISHRDSEIHYKNKLLKDSNTKEGAIKESIMIDVFNDTFIIKYLTHLLHMMEYYNLDSI